MTTDDLIRLIEQDAARHRRPDHDPRQECGHCPRSFATVRGRSLHMAQRHPVEWEAEGVATGKGAKRAYYRERKRFYTAKDPERYRGHTKRWREANPERVKETITAWKAERSDHVEAYQVAWRDANRDHVLEYAIERRLRGLAATPSKESLTRARRKRAIRDRINGARAARYAVAKALAHGVLSKTPCEVCGAPKVEGHHYLGYAVEHQLDVQWLCKEHHVEQHHPDGVARRRRVAQRLAEAAA